MPDLLEIKSNPVFRPGERDEARFVVGRDAEGHWLAIDAGGRGGGLFVTRDAALHYAEFESDHRPGAVRIASEPVRLPM